MVPHFHSPSLASSRRFLAVLVLVVFCHLIVFSILSQSCISDLILQVYRSVDFIQAYCTERECSLSIALLCF